MKKRYTTIFVNENVKPTLFFLKSIIEPQIQRNISFGNLVWFSLDFLSQKIEDDEFEKIFIEYIKKRVKRGDGDEEGVVNKSPQ